MTAGARRLVGSGLALAAALAAAAWCHGRQLPRWQQPAPELLLGAFHVHSEASHDSALSAAAIGAAARADGLDFVVLTDHNAQPPPPPGMPVRLLSFAELSTRFGHCVQLGGRATPPPAERGAANILEALRGAGVAPILAHPSDRKRPWTGDTQAAAGLEVVNLAAAARRALAPVGLGLLPLALAWPLNAPLALAQLYGRDALACAAWDRRPEPDFVGLCGSDAHGWIDPALNLLAWHVALALPRQPLPDDAAIVAALREGRFFCAAGLLGPPPRLAFEGQRQAAVTARPGDSVRHDALDRLSVEVGRLAGAERRIVLLRDGHEVGRQLADRLVLEAPPPGAYRVEVWVPLPGLLAGSRWVPALYSNRIRVTAAS